MLNFKDKISEDLSLFNAWIELNFALEPMFDIGSELYP